MMGIVAEDDGIAFTSPRPFEIRDCVLRANGMNDDASGADEQQRQDKASEDESHVFLPAKRLIGWARTSLNIAAKCLMTCELPNDISGQSQFGSRRKGSHK